MIVPLDDLPQAPWPLDYDEIANVLGDETHYGFYVYPDRSPGENQFAQGVPRPFVYCSDAKWYDYWEDVPRVVQQLGVGLAVYGWGEEEGDVWVHYFSLDGRSSGKLMATIQWPQNPL